MEVATNSTCTKAATSSTSVPHKVQWPQTVHVPPVLHAVASSALLAQLVLLYMKGAEKLKKYKCMGQFSVTQQRVMTICVW